MTLHCHLLGMPTLNRENEGLRRAKQWPCIVTCDRWLAQYHVDGHVLPKRRTGNHRSTREIKGIPLVNLAIYRSIRPKATIAEVKAFLFIMDPDIHPYSDSQICRAESHLGLVRLISSTTADQAYLPINIEKQRMYWNKDYPLGV